MVVDLAFGIHLYAYGMPPSGNRQGESQAFIPS